MTADQSVVPALRAGPGDPHTPGPIAPTVIADTHDQALVGLDGEINELEDNLSDPSPG